jgi:Big-like domain-containing protein
LKKLFSSALAVAVVALPLLVVTTSASAITHSATIGVSKVLANGASANSPGYVSSSDGKIDCGSTCSHTYNWNCAIDPVTHELNCDTPVVTLTAASANGFTFSHWGDGCTTVSANTCTVTVDDAGGTDTTATAFFNDVEAPVATLTAPTGPEYVRGTILLSATAVDNSGVVSRVDFLARGVQLASDSTAPYTASFDTTTRADGAATISARAVDPSALVSASSSATITIDNTSPYLGSLAGPGAGPFKGGTTQSFTWTVSDATSGLQSVQCKLDSGTFGACTTSSSESYTDLGGGSHTLTVKATDNAGNVSTTSTSWSIDATPPVLSAISGPGPGPFGPGSTEALSWTVNDAQSGVASVLCSLDGATATPCDSQTSQSYSHLGGGAHTLTVVATDGVGNTTSQQASWSVDATPPTISVASIKFGQTISSVRKKGLSATANLSEAGAMTGKLEIARKLAKKLHVSKVIGSQKVELSYAGPARLKVKLTPAASKAVKHLSKLPVALVLSAKDAAGNKAKPKVLKATLH